MNFQASKSPTKSQYLSLAIAILLSILMFIAMLGWMINIPAMYGVWWEQAPPLLPITVLCLILASQAMLLTHASAFRRPTLIILFVIGSGILWLALHELLVMILPTDPSLLFNSRLVKTLNLDPQDYLPTIQMVLTLMVFGASLSLLAINNFYTIYLSQLLQVLFIMMMITISFGYIYKQRSFLDYTTELGMTFHTSILLTLASIMILLARPDLGFLKILSGNSSGAILMRYTLPLLVIIPLFFGWLVFLGYKAELYTERFSIALLESLSVLLTALVLIIVAHYISYQQTLRKRAERHVLKTQKELAHIVRVHSMGELASGLAHELNQPLAAINLYASTCKRQLANLHCNEGELEKNLGAIKEQSHRASEIIKRMRNFLQKQQPVEDVVNLNKILDDVLALQKHVLYQNGITVFRGCPKVLPAIKADEIQIGQIFLNLTQNAIDSMRLDVGKPHQLIIKCHSNIPEMIRIDVTDTGPGIPVEVKSKLFDAFFSTKGEAGLGVGLSISRNIAEFYGGTLKYHDQEGRGTTFSVTFPTVESAPRQ